MTPEFGGKWRTECLNTRFPAVCGIQREADKLKREQKKNLPEFLIFELFFDGVGKKKLIISRYNLYTFPFQSIDNRR